MVWLDLEFNNIRMTITIPLPKLKEVSQLVAMWRGRKSATTQQLYQLFSKHVFISQCCPPARFFVHCMLETLRECLAVEVVELSNEFCKDLNWFHAYMPSTKWGVSHP